MARYEPFPARDFHEHPGGLRLPVVRHDHGQDRPRSARAESVAVVRAKVRIPRTDALPRERLEAQLAAAAARHRLTLVIAPAGSGKTTLLSRFAAQTDLPVAWYRAEPWDDDPDRLFRHLEAALVDAMPGMPTGWRDVEAAAAALDEWTGGPGLLVIDDLHGLEGTAAEVALSRLVDYAPPWLRILAGSRVRPGFNLSRLRVSGQLHEIEGDDLRFRAWEVERLFRDFYRDPVLPGELAVLARRTEGWAAGLQLFHLATRGKSADERRRILGGAGSSSRLVREYLASNVLAELPDDLRRFLIDTSALVRLTGSLCDQLLDRKGSASLLEELARRQIFTVAIDDVEPSFRYHEVLRSHLDRVLVEEVGETEARARHRRAAALLEASDALPEALLAYCRAEDWTAVRNLVGNRGERVADGAGLQLELLPPAVVRDSPWLALAAARRARSEGRWRPALDAYARAEAGFGGAGTGSIARQERLTLAAWLDPVAIPPVGWAGVLRAGLVREPMSVAREARHLDATHAALVRGLLQLAAGDVRDAQRALEAASQAEDLDAVLGVAAGMGAAVAALLGGHSVGGAMLEDAIDAAERLGANWLARLGRVASAIGNTDPDAARVAEGFMPDEDPWGAALAALVEAWAPKMTPGTGAGAGTGADARVAAADRAAVLLRRLGAGVLEALARGLSAFGQAEGGAPEARDAAIAAESLARATGTSAPRLLAYAALSSLDDRRRPEYDELMVAAQRESGLVLPKSAAVPISVESVTDRVVFAPRPRGEDGAAGRQGAVAIRVLGPFTVVVAGEPISLDHIKPRARALLRFLAMQPGVAVHREVIQEALWPDADPMTAARSMQVAISALRGLFADALGAREGRIVAREGDAYRLAVDPRQVDVGRFELAIERARGASGSSAAREYQHALREYLGDLLPQDGPADWVVERRDRLRRDAVEASTRVAEAAMAAGDLDATIRECQRGLELDRFHDPLWRLLFLARDQAGDAGAANRDRREYASVLAAIGASPEVPLAP